MKNPQDEFGVLDDLIGMSGMTTMICGDDFGEVLANYRALSLVYQQIHWQSQGPNFYQEHLLAERLLDEADASVDEVSEKGIAATGDRGFVNVVFQIGLVNTLVADMAALYVVDTTVGFMMALELETGLMQVLNRLFSQAGSDASLSDFFGALADMGLQRMYLLKGRLAQVDEMVFAASVEFGGPGSGPRNHEGGVGELDRPAVPRGSVSDPDPDFGKVGWFESGTYPSIDDVENGESVFNWEMDYKIPAEGGHGYNAATEVRLADGSSERFDAVLHESEPDPVTNESEYTWEVHGTDGSEGSPSSFLTQNSGTATSMEDAQINVEEALYDAAYAYTRSVEDSLQPGQRLADGSVKENPDQATLFRADRSKGEFGGPGSGPRNSEGGVGELNREGGGGSGGNDSGGSGLIPYGSPGYDDAVQNYVNEQLAILTPDQLKENYAKFEDFADETLYGGEIRNITEDPNYKNELFEEEWIAQMIESANMDAYNKQDPSLVVDPVYAKSELPDLIREVRYESQGDDLRDNPIYYGRVPPVG